MKIIKLSVEEIINDLGWEKEDCNFDGVDVECGYIDENYESGYLGLKLKNGKYCVVGLNGDGYVDDYEEMCVMIENGL